MWELVNSMPARIGSSTVWDGFFSSCQRKCREKEKRLPAGRVSTTSLIDTRMLRCYGGVLRRVTVAGFGSPKLECDDLRVSTLTAAT